LFASEQPLPHCQCGFYLDSKFVRGLGNDGLTIGITPIAARIVWVAIDEIWGIGFWMRSMELQFP